MKTTNTVMPDNPKGLKPSEFYEKYFRVDDGHGNMVHPRPLTEREKEFLDNADAAGGEIGILWNKKTRRLVLSAEDIELWKPVNGYEGVYEISNHGRVKRLTGYCKNRADGRMRFMPEHIRECKWKSGYSTVQFRLNGNDKRINMHLLVAQYFIPNPNNLPLVNHKDGDKSNNHYKNLEWCDNSYNIKHAYKNGLNKGRRGKKYPVSSDFPLNIKVDYFDKDNNYIRTFNSMGEASRITGIRQSSISQSVRNDLKKARKYIFKLSKCETK